MARGEVTGRKTTVTDPDYEDEIAPLPRLAMTIPQFAAAHGFSQAMYFKQKKLGKGPREFKVGRRTLIAFEAAAKWRAEREAASDPLLGKAVKGDPIMRRHGPEPPRKKPSNRIAEP